MPVVAPIALRGIGTRPLTPVHPQLLSRADGSLHLRWTRRARGCWIWPDGVELPLNEQTEAYTVTYRSGAAVLAAWAVATPMLLLSASELTALTALAAHGTFDIRQRGDRALSDPLTITLP